MRGRLPQPCFRTDAHSLWRREERRNFCGMNGLRLVTQARPEARGDLTPGQEHRPLARAGALLSHAQSTQPSNLEKSATASVAARISLSRRSRFARTGLSSVFTVTLSKYASTCGRSFAMALMAAA